MGESHLACTSSSTVFQFLWEGITFLPLCEESGRNISSDQFPLGKMEENDPPFSLEGSRRLARVILGPRVGQLDPLLGL